MKIGTLLHYDLTTLKKLWVISWPLIMVNAIVNTQALIDRIILSHYSPDALAATVLSIGIFWVPLSLIHQTVSYISVVSAQYSVLKKRKMIGPIFWQVIYFGIVASLLLLVLIPFSPYIFRLFGHAEQLYLLEVSYFNKICFSALPIAVMTTISSFFTGIERSHVVIRIYIITLISNSLLDYVLVFGYFGLPELGIVGAGIATVISSYAGCTYGCFLLFNRKLSNRYSIWKEQKLSWKLMKKFLRFGLPSGCQMSLEGAANGMFLILLGCMPNATGVLAASSIMISIISIANLPVFAIAQGASVLVGKYLGSGSISRARFSVWSSVYISSLYVGVLSLIFLLFPKLFLNWFKGAENIEIWNYIEEIIPTLFIFLCVYIIFNGFSIIFSFALKGAGDVNFVSFITLVLPLPLMIVPTYFSISLSNGVFCGWTFACLFYIVQSIIFFLRFQQGKWEKMRVVES